MSSSPFEEPASPISDDSDGIDESYMLQLQHAQGPSSPRGFNSPFEFLKEASSGPASAFASGSGGGGGGKRRMPLSGWFGGPGARDTKSRRREEREPVGMGMGKRGHGQVGGQGGWPSSELVAAGRAREELLDHAQVERIRSAWGDPFDDAALKARS